MITETVLSAIFNGVLSLISGLVDAMTSAMSTAPDFVFGIPSPLWFVVSYLMLQMTVLYPLAFSWWVWRQVKG